MIKHAVRRGSAGRRLSQYSITGMNWGGFWIPTPLSSTSRREAESLEQEHLLCSLLFVQYTKKEHLREIPQPISCTTGRNPVSGWYCIELYVTYSNRNIHRRCKPPAAGPASAGSALALLRGNQRIRTQDLLLSQLLLSCVGRSSQIRTEEPAARADPGALMTCPLSALRRWAVRSQTLL